MTHWFLTIATAVGKPRDNQLWVQLLKDLWQELLHLLRFSDVRLAKSSLEHDLPPTRCKKLLTSRSG